MGIQNPILYFPQKTFRTTKVQFRCFWTDLNIFFLWLGNLMGIQNPILYFPHMTVRTTKVHFCCFWTDLNIFFFRLGKLMGNQNPILYFLQMTVWTTKVQFTAYGPIWIFFLSLIWKFDRDSKSDYVLQKFVIMIIFDIIWYAVIFAANLYLSIFVWSSDILNLWAELLGSLWTLFLTLLG